jgi:transcriptional regulator with XRE-family HTH domain
LSFKHTLNNTLEYLIKKWGININQLHKHTGIPLSTLKRLRLNKENNPTLASLTPIASFFSVSLDQLIGKTPLPSKNKTETNSITIPLIAWKDIIDSSKNRWRLAFSSVIIIGTYLNKESYALLIENNNWNNFLAGSLLVIDPSLNPHNRDFIIVYKKGQLSPELRQVLIYKNKRYLKNVNSESEIIDFSEKYKNLGVIIEIKMNYKKSNAYVNFEDEKSDGAKKY